ncbi:MAG: CHRD domain-containing protein, partial [Bacteroidia bacterium]|nr:CHRD domain-containing protein [Bacteroidia bacterium]
MLALCQQYKVQTFVGAHHAAYYPGRRRGIDVLNLGEQSRGGEALTNTSITTPTSTTIIDIYEDDPFFGDSLVYTTFDLFDDLSVVTYEESPIAVFSFNGHLIRRDIPVFEEGTASLSGLNMPTSNQSPAIGSAETRLNGNRIEFSGTFSNLEGRVLQNPSAIAIYTGLNDQTGTAKYLLNVNSSDGKSGSFSGSFDYDPDFAELLSIGYYQVTIKTEKYPEGEIRGHLYPLNNEAPVAPMFSSHNVDSIFPVRDVLALYTVAWSEAKDANQNPVTYIYQLAKDADFNELLISASTGIERQFNQLTEETWYGFLGESNPGEVVNFYHRVMATDGQKITFGAAELLKLTKDDSPITEPIDIPAPEFKYQGIFAQLSGFRGYDVAIDEQTGRIWASTYRNPDGFWVFNADGTPYQLTDPALEYEAAGNVAYLTFKGVRYNLDPCYGIEWMEDGSVVVAGGLDLFKLDAATGKPLAVWEAPNNFGAETNPSVDNEGRVFIHDVFPGNAAYILKRSEVDTTTFDLVSMPVLNQGANVSRSSAFSPEGDVIYLPDAAAARGVFIYTSQDRENFTFSSRFDMPAPTGSNAIVAGPDSTFWVVNNRGQQPPRLIFIDMKQQLRWDFL